MQPTRSFFFVIFVILGSVSINNSIAQASTITLGDNLDGLSNIAAGSIAPFLISHECPQGLTCAGTVQVLVQVNNGIISKVSAKVENDMAPSLFTDAIYPSFINQAIPFLVKETITTSGKSIVGVGGAEELTKAWQGSLNTALENAKSRKWVLVSAADTQLTCNIFHAKVPNQLSIAKPDFSTSVQLSQVIFHTNCGDIVIDTSKDNAPLAKDAISQLATHGYFDGTLCHRLSTSQIFIVQCGDPTASGQGNPGWTFPNENLPPFINQSGLFNYPVGTVAMENSGPNTNGSQFFMTYENTSLLPSFSIWGHVISGLSILNYVASKGIENGGTDGTPRQKLGINSVDLVYQNTALPVTIPTPKPNGLQYIGNNSTSFNFSSPISLNTVSSSEGLKSVAINYYNGSISLLTTAETKLVSLQSLIATNGVVATSWNSILHQFSDLDSKTVNLGKQIKEDLDKGISDFTPDSKSGQTVFNLLNTYLNYIYELTHPRAISSKLPSKQKFMTWCKYSKVLKISKENAKCPEGYKLGR